MTWRLAKSLETLRSEINVAAPHRSKASDGTIGDPAHASRASRHNPNAEGVVCAIDITDDPNGGCPIHVWVRALVARLRAGGATNPDLEYIISNREIFKRSSGWHPEDYHGSNPHDKHAHFAVGRGPDAAPAVPYDDTIPWNIAHPAQEADLTPDEHTELINIRQTGINTENRVVGLEKRAANIDTALDQIVMPALGRLEKAVAALRSGGVDEDALAEKIAANLAKRLES